eukprot:m.116149 g.116149  ORF g.116149 m.116149 type:complete len:141 (+) comp9497_c0_seq2:169-591(+)
MHAALHCIITSVTLPNTHRAAAEAFRRICQICAHEVAQTDALDVAVKVVGEAYLLPSCPALVEGLARAIGRSPSHILLGEWSGGAGLRVRLTSCSNSPRRGHLSDAERPPRFACISGAMCGKRPGPRLCIAADSAARALS